MYCLAFLCSDIPAIGNFVSVLILAEAEGIRKIDRVAVRIPVRVEPAGQPNRIFLGKAPLPSRRWGC
jgi:hypothetical protein